MSIRSAGIWLTDYEQAIADLTGFNRGFHSKKMDLKDSHGLEETKPGNHFDVIGTRGELACALIQGVAWVPTLWTNWEEREEVKASEDLWGHAVRTASPGNYGLIARQQDLEEDPSKLLILVHCLNETHTHFYIYGSLPISECVKPEYVYEGGKREPCWIVPKHRVKRGRGCPTDDPDHVQYWIEHIRQTEQRTGKTFFGQREIARLKEKIAVPDRYVRRFPERKKSFPLASALGQGEA